MKTRPHVIVLWVLIGVLAFLAIMLAVPAYAAVVGEWSVNLIRGSSGTFATLRASTQEQAWADCRQLIAAQPPSSTQWTCQTPRYVARVIADPSVCTAPQPPNETRPGQCPTGTTGSWSQSLSYVSAPYPTCWTAGPWVPAEPPVGACVEPPPPPPPPTGEWTHCANQEQRCEFSGQRRVRFGADIRWVEREFTGGVLCNATSFGGINPASGALKTCQLQGAVSPPPTEPPPTEPPPTGTGSVALRWTAPSTNIDDTPLTDLSGYRIHFGRSIDQLNQAIEIGPDLTRYVVEGLGAGTWYFGMAARSPRGDSAMSSIVSTTVAP